MKEVTQDNISKILSDNETRETGNMDFSNLDAATIVAAARNLVTDNLAEFFRVELRNGEAMAREEGFDEAAVFIADGIEYDFRQTVGTAVSSLAQAPDEILDTWQIGRRDLITLAEIACLVGVDFELEDLI